MRKNQKYSNEQKHLAIEKWQASGLTQLQFCKREKLSKSTFSYWLRKYKKEKGQSKPSQRKPIKTFIPVEVPRTMDAPVLGNGQIDITYPNGVKVSCPESINVHQLKSLISIL
jgi:transposase-like protein